MCEFCGCGLIRSEERPLEQRKPKGRALGVRVKAAPAKPKFVSPVTTDSREKPHSALEELTAEHG